MTTHRIAFLFIITSLLGLFNVLPPPMTIIAEPMPVTINISQIRNSCITNNANTALHSINGQIDARDNWWGMPTGASYDGVSAGDLVGQNVLSDPHLPLMPFLCDLLDADWIPFSEQELQHAIQQQIPHLRGIGFALIDLEWGQGAKFDIVTQPDYGSVHDVAFISMMPNATGELITLQLDVTRLPSDETVRQIAICELMPLFINSIQSVQNRLVAPSQNITSMVVMESSLMIRFASAEETTPEPAPEIIMAYDTSCLPLLEPLHDDEDNDDEMAFFVIPPIDGVELMTMPDDEDFQLMQSPEVSCDGSGQLGFECMLAEGEVFTFVNTDYTNRETAFISMNNVDGTILTVHHVPVDAIGHGIIPSWGVISETQTRLAFGCVGIKLCYWDSQSNTSLIVPDAYAGITQSQMSRDGTQIIYALISYGYDPNGYRIYDLNTGMTTTFNTNLRIRDPRWSDNHTPYYLRLTGTQTPSISMMSHVANHVPLGGSGSLFTTGLAGQYRYDVHEGDVLYWKAEGSGYRLWRTHQGSHEPLVYSNRLTEVHWSPDGTRFILVYPEQTYHHCIRLYEIANIGAGYKTIACGDYRDSVAWAGGVDLSHLLAPPDPDVCLAEISTPAQGYNGWRVREGPYESSRFIENIPANTSVVILGGNSRRYLIRYGNDNKEGWVLQNAVRNLTGNKCLNLPLLDEAGNELQAVHNYTLDSPPSDWLDLN